MRVQVSHSPENRKFVDQLESYPWSIGVEPRRDYLKTPETQKSAERLDKELRRYDYIIVVLSQAYVGDQWLMNELLQSLLREQADQRRFILPLLAEECEVPFWLATASSTFAAYPSNRRWHPWPPRWPARARCSW
jgi:hypothetical protein